MARRKRTEGAYTISVVANQFGVHPQTLRLYEREGLLKPSRTEGNTRLYTEADMQQLEVILSLTRDLGVNLAGVEIILNMRRKMEEMQRQMAGVRRIRHRTNGSPAARTATGIFNLVDPCQPAGFPTPWYPHQDHEIGGLGPAQGPLTRRWTRGRLCNPHETGRGIQLEVICSFGSNQPLVPRKIGE